MSCLPLNKNKVKGFVLDIVKGYPLTQCKTPNSFASVSGFQEMIKSNLGKTYDDYLDGSFWARDWAAGGADSNTLKREFPLALLECPQFKLKGSKECNQYAITVIGEYDCKECKGCNRTKSQVSEDTRKILLNILREFGKFGLFENDDREKVWVSKSYGESQGWEYEEECIYDCLEEQEISPYEISKGMPNLVGWTVQFEICDCSEYEDLEFNYGQEDNPSIGVLECDDCP